MALLEDLFKSSRTQYSKRETSIIFSLFATPALLIKFFIEFGVYPLRLSPEMVGILGSSQPRT